MTTYTESLPREALIEVIKEQQGIIEQLRHPVTVANLNKSILSQPIVDLVANETARGYTLSINWPDKIGNKEYTASETIWGPSETKPHSELVAAVVAAFGVASKLHSWGRDPIIDPSMANKYMRGEF